MAKFGENVDRLEFTTQLVPDGLKQSLISRYMEIFTIVTIFQFLISAMNYLKVSWYKEVLELIEMN